MFKRLLIIVFVYIVFFFPQSASMQESETVVSPVSASLLQANAGEDRSVRVGTEIIFDASDSFVPEDIIPVYSWDMGNGKTEQGLRPLFIYDAPGEYRVKLTVRAESDRTIVSVDELIVRVFEQQAILLGRLEDFSRNRLTEMLQTIEANNIAVETLLVEESVGSEIMSRSGLRDRLLSIRQIVSRSDMIIVIDRFAAEILIDYAQTFSDDLEGKTIAVIRNDNRNTFLLQDLVQMIHNVTNVEAIRMAQFDQLPEDFFGLEMNENEVFLSQDEAGRPHLKSLDFLYYMNANILQAGISIDFLYLLYMVFLVSIFGLALRKILGLSVVGIQTLSLSVLAIYTTGVIVGLIVFTLFTALYFIIRRVYRTDYISFFSSQFIDALIVVLVTCLGVILLFNFYVEFPVTVEVLFAFIILSISARRLSLSMVDKSFHIVFGKYIQEILFFLLNILLFSIESVRMMILLYSELYILFVMLLAIFLEKYTGLRFTEYVRFRRLLSAEEE